MMTNINKQSVLKVNLIGCLFAEILSISTVYASDEQESAIWLGLKSSFSLPLEELLIQPSDNEWNNVLKGTSIRVAYGYPLTKATVAQGAGSQGESATNDTVQLGIKYTPISYWYINATFIKYLQPELQKSWDSDISYSFGYDDWHPYTLSLSYANSLGNRLSPKKPRFNEGTWTLGWKLPVSDTLKSWLVSGYGDAIGCGTAFSFTPKYMDSFTNSEKNNKMNLSLGCKYTIVGAWYVNFNVLYYPDKTQQQPWNPDYTYGFGFFDWRPGKISVQYNNYSGNRFTSSERAAGTGHFHNGSISVAWSKSW